MESQADNSKWGKTGCGIMFLVAIAVPIYLLGGPLIFAGIFVFGAFGYFLWVHNSRSPEDSNGEGEDS